MDIQICLFIYACSSRVKVQSFAASTVFQNVLLVTTQIPVLALRRGTEEQVPQQKSELFIHSEIFKL